jgi:cytochrome c oxidase subunit 1
LLGAETYNKVFTAHGVIMVFFFLIPSIPAVLGNFLVPMMIGAKDVAFPKLNLLSWYLFVGGVLMALIALMRGSVATGWTFYAPLSSTYTDSTVVWVITGAFLGRLLLHLDGLELHRHHSQDACAGADMVPPAALYLVALCNELDSGAGNSGCRHYVVAAHGGEYLPRGVFDPSLGGDPVLFQHLFWFYSHPAVYIMVLPGFAVISEVITCMSRKPIFGYKFIAFSSIAIAIFGFLVWGHHLFVSSQSAYAASRSRSSAFLVAIPSAIKVFNWTATLYKGSIRFSTPMLVCAGLPRPVHHRRPDRLAPGGCSNGCLPDRYLLRGCALPLRDGRRHGVGLLCGITSGGPR